MPNAPQSSVSSNGNRSYHWDAVRQLAYEWLNHAGSVGPRTLGTVRDDRTGITYNYHRWPPPGKRNASGTAYLVHLSKTHSFALFNHAYTPRSRYPSCRSHHRFIA